MGCSQTKTRQSISLNLTQMKSSQNEQNNNKYNIMKNPIIQRRAERRNKMSQTTACTLTLI